MSAIDTAIKAAKDDADGKVPLARTIAGMALSGDITLEQMIAAGLASGTNGDANNALKLGGVDASAIIDGEGNAQNALKLGGVDAANFPQISTGTWTPTLFGTTTAGSPTYSEALGVWHKIGKLVIALFILKISAKGGITGNVTVGGLPFVPNQYGAGHYTFGEYSGITLAEGTILCASPVDPNGIPLLAAGNTGSINVDASMLGDSFSMWDSGAGFYMTDQ